MNIASLLLLLGTLLTLALAVHTQRQPVFPGKFHYIAMLVAAAWWSAAAGIELAVSSPQDKVLAAKLAWPGIVAAPSYWTLFIWAYVKGDYQRPPLAWHLGLLVMPVLTCAIALSNDSHQLMYLSTLPVSAEPGAAIDYRHGPWFFFCTLYLYGYMTLSMLVIINALARANTLYQRHYLGFALAMAIPWLVNAAHVTGLLLFFHYDPTPFSFLVMGLVFYWLISRRQLFELLPIAHDVLLDAVPDAVLVINERHRIAQLNRAAQSLPGMPQPAIGMPLTGIGELQSLLPTLWEQSGQTECEIGIAERYYDLRAVTVHYRRHPVGLLLVLHDITQRKHVQLELHQALQSLEDQLDSNAALQAQLHEAAIRDPLTGLHNRRFLAEISPKLLASAARTVQPLALVMLDLDHFKAINDRHGHAAGDAVLSHVAGLLQEHARQSDFLFRIGGEEFLALLPDTTRDEAVALAEGWLARLSLAPAQAGGQTLAVSFSAGVAVIPDDGQSLEQAMQHADQALYTAKHSGRKRVCAGQTTTGRNTPGQLQR